MGFEDHDRVLVDADNVVSTTTVLSDGIFRDG